MAGIYKAYDIRGIAGSEISEELAYKVGRAFARVTKSRGKTIVVGHDMRPTSGPYSRQLIRGLRDEGVDVVDAGLVSTPLFYFAARQHDGGCMVTASHNPPEYNGFKFVLGNLPVSYATGIREMESLIAQGLPAPETSPELGGAPGDSGLESAGSAVRGSLRSQDFLQDFLSFSLSFLQTSKPVSIVVDAANGMGGLTYRELLPQLQERGVTVHPLFFELDGTFPNHEANPLKLETLEAVKQAVQHTGAALGVALDGDGDRCVFIDEKGNHLSSDLTLGLVAGRLLARRQGPVVLDLRCSRAVREHIESLGGTVIPSAVGYAHIKPLCREHKAVIGGEISGHFFPEETGYNENTFFMLFQMLNLLEERGVPLSELVQPLRKYAFSGEINSAVADADAVLAAVEKEYGSREGAELSRLDGVRIEFPTWFCSVRKSNTEPVVRLIVEADTQDEMERHRDELLRLIRSH